MSVLENVSVGALFGTNGGERNLGRAREQARACLKFVGLGKRITQRADALGGPDRKRLELARALAMKPRLLLLDEVMAGLNHVEIEEVIEDIKKVTLDGVRKFYTQFYGAGEGEISISGQFDPPAMQKLALAEPPFPTFTACEEDALQSRPGAVALTV